MKLSALLLAGSAILLTACDQIGQRLGLEDPQAKEIKADAEGKAVGSACRQSGRAIEDCYSLYRWLPKASIFAGWREMNDYMQSNKLDVVEPKLPPAPGPEDKRKKAKAEAEAKPEEKKSGEAEAKPDDKAADKKTAAKEETAAEPKAKTASKH